VLQTMWCNAQIKEPQDSFFLLKKKGLLQRLGRSIYVEDVPDNPVKAIDPFLPFKGMTIRTIQIAPTGFNKIINDSIEVKKNFAAKLADAFHKNTLQTVIRKNLFFKEGDKLLPLLFSDNERFLRDLPYLKDALIVVKIPEGYENTVDILIVTREVFSIGGNAGATLTRAQVTGREENFAGTGNKFEGTVFYDKERKNHFGIGASITKRNIKKSFINWALGFNTFNPAFNSGRREETSFYTAFDKPLVSRYTLWTGAASVAFNVASNQYLNDSLFNTDFKYKAVASDFWAGYNIGAKNKKEADGGNRLRHFVAMRTFYNNFYSVPDKFSSSYNYSYADINGLLTSYSLYRQNFYRTNFIYGFGRNEDVPEGINATITGGYTNKEGIKRAYYGLELDATDFSDKGFFTGYTLRLGSFWNNKKFQDADIVLGLNRFTKLFKLRNKWSNRNFLSFNFTKQFNNVLSPPLFLESIFGLPYFRNSIDIADTRLTLKMESVFFNMRKFFGFRFAPFVFTDMIFLKPRGLQIDRTNGYTALGGGLRTRNENLTFGTVELRSYFFPRVNDGMKKWRVEVGTNLKFRYNSSFIRRPDFISAN
jgi:hypothetical protein